MIDEKAGGPVQASGLTVWDEYFKAALAGMAGDVDEYVGDLALVQRAARLADMGLRERAARWSAPQ